MGRDTSNPPKSNPRRIRVTTTVLIPLVKYQMRISGLTVREINMMVHHKQSFI